ncbi:hypothetical protein EDD11_008337 [Mortierella claussenii]|nr:hypothetical protein EDD11_008337 [Mortierella claussenii]
MPGATDITTKRDRNTHNDKNDVENEQDQTANHLSAEARCTRIRDSDKETGASLTTTSLQLQGYNQEPCNSTNGICGTSAIQKDYRDIYNKETSDVTAPAQELLIRAPEQPPQEDRASKGNSSPDEVMSAETLDLPTGLATTTTNTGLHTQYSAEATVVSISPPLSGHNTPYSSALPLPSSTLLSSTLLSSSCSDIKPSSFVPFDPQPWETAVAEHRLQAVRNFQVISGALDNINAEIQFIFSEFLTRQYEQIEETLRSGHARIAQQEQEQECIRTQMASFLNAMKTAFQVFGQIE